MFSGFHFRLTTAMLLVFGCGAPSIAQNSKLEQLLQRSPLPPNSVSYLHTSSLKKLLADAQLTLEIADEAEEVWLVSDVDTVELKPNWEAGYATLNQKLDADSLAKRLGGYVDRVGDQAAVWTPKQSYVVPVGENRVGFLRPAKRNLLVDWMEGSGESPTPDFLVAQSKQPEQYLSFLLAVDLKNNFSAIDLVNRVSSFTSLQSQDPQAIAQLLSTVQGISLIVGRQSLAECILTVEFGQSPASIAANGAALLNEVLNRNGTAAPEVASWKTKVDGNKLLFQGPISAESLDSVLGIFSIRGHAEEISETRSPMNPTTQNSSAVQVASKEYFDKVNAFIERVRKYNAQSTGYRAKWDEQQARRIDELGTLNVDPQLIEYGATVSSILRGNSTAIRVGNVAAGQVQAGQANSSGYYGGYYGGYAGGVYVSDRAAMNNAMTTGTQQRMAAGGSYRVALANIDQLTGAVRRAMTEKYKVQF